MNLDTLTDEILEKTTPTITAYLTDENGDAVPVADIATLTLTLYGKETKAIINTRNDQDVLNLNGVTVEDDSTGTLITWELDIADTAILGTRAEEDHRAVFKWTWGSTERTGRHIIDMTVVNLAKVI